MTQRELECELCRLSFFSMGTSSVTSWLSARPGDQAPIMPVAPDQPAALLVSIAFAESPSATALFGKAAFEAKCPASIGVNGAGRADVATPLLHKNHEPSRHGAKALPRAVALAARQQCSPFGNVPPADGLARADIVMRIAHLRDLQRANGIN